MIRRTRRLLAASAVVLLAGCGGSGGVSAALEPREWRVAEDPDATPTEVVEAGGPVDVAVSGGQRLTTWQVEPDDDEGPHQGAWRLHDAGGGLVAEGGFGTVTEQGAGIGVEPVPDGFVLESYTEPFLWHVDREGTPSEVRVGRERRATRAGDLLVRWSDGAERVYRPSDRSAARLPALPTRNPQSVAVTGTGEVAVLLPWGEQGGARVATSRDGRAPWSTARLPLPRGAYPVIELHAVDDRLLLLTSRPSEEQPEGYVDTFWSRPAGGSWTSVPYDGGRLEDFDGAEPFLLDGRPLVASYSEGAWIEGPGGFEAVDLPTEDASVQVAGDDLYALDRRDNTLHVSSDLGATWSEVER